MILPMKYFLIFLVVVTITFLFFAVKIDNQNGENIETKAKLTEDDLRFLDKSLSTKKQNKKIIISVNKGGPNNQMWGLRGGLFLSHLLGREFVPPLFFRHKFTKGHFYINPDIFIDLDNLSRLESRIFNYLIKF